MLCGICPFEGRTTMDIFKKIWGADPTSPRKLNSRVGRDADTIVMKCLDKAPDKRYFSAVALKEDIERHLQGRAILARPITFVEKLARWVRRNKVAGIGIAAGVLAVLVVALILWRQDVAQTNKRMADRAKAEQLFRQAKTAFDENEYQKSIELL